MLYVFISMTHRKQSVLVGLLKVEPEARFFGLDRRDLEHIVEVLNEKGNGRPTAYAEALVQLVERLKGCDGNLKKMMDDDPELERVVTTVCGGCWRLTATGRAHMVLQPSWEQILLSSEPGQMVTARPERMAALLFHVGTLNPEWDKLAGPCARCGRYYLKKRASQKIYCSRRCGNAATAVARTRERIAAERKDKLKRAKAAIRKWRSATTQQDWKSWVEQTTKIDPRFLTRAVHKGDLVPPKKGR